MLTKRYLIALVFIAGFAGCSLIPSGVKNHGVTAPGATVEKLAGGYTWAEGPVLDIRGNLFFTDNRENLLHKLSPEGTASVFLKDAKRANGLYRSKDGALLACTGAPKQLVSIDPETGVITTLADSFNGKPLNSPNDLWLDPGGGIYFTDPYWGKEKGRDKIMYLSPDGTTLIIAANDMVKPNGIIGTPDGKTVYVSDWNEKKTYTYTVKADGTLSGKRLFAPEGDDGLALDTRGNVYLSGKAVTVYRSTGEKIDTIEVPEIAANMCFGGKGNKTLYITARTSVYSIKMRVKGR
ncbi:SMP-30/gluconolactonase/LRE family protein [Candidatus Latescibacterota bacterium]